MSDLVDQAQALEQMHREAAMAAHASRSTLCAEAATHCEAPRCGQAIPDARRRAVPGVRLCVECQAELERQGRRGA